MTILYLYAEVMGYTLSTIRQLSEEGADVHVVYWDKKGKKTPYIFSEMDGVTFYPKSEYTPAGLHDLTQQIEPNLLVVSGWQDKDYLSLSKKARKKSIPVVVGLDGQWSGTLKQQFGRLLAKFGYFRNYYSNAWVAGSYQYEYARKFGFSKNEIIFDLYSADINLFNDSYKKSRSIKENSYPHRFLYVGRFAPEKGLNTLLKAWDSLKEQRKDWELHLIGNGAMREELSNHKGITVKEFLQPEELASEVTEAGCFILPSRHEPWGVVVHEFAASGLPVIASQNVGAVSSFLTHGYNGFHFKSDDDHSLKTQLLRVIESEDSDLLKMSERSNQIAQRITPSTSAAELLSLLRNETYTR